jgi:sigma-B regulation protein RsbU (phosphoserine phosphatase)
MSSPVQINELSRTVERLHRIVGAAKLLNSTIDLSELTGIILQIARDEVGVERGSVFVLEDAPNGARQLRSLVAQDIAGSFTVAFGHGIAGTVAATGEVLDIPNAYEDSRFDPSFDTRFGFRTRDIYCMPVRNRDDGVVGVLQLLNRRKPFTTVDEEFLSGLSVHIGLALENASLHRQIVEKKRIEEELRLAREIQQAFRPNIPESHGGVQIAASSEMCHEVGGDYHAFFSLGEKQFIVMLGDVSGKGIGAALVMTSVHSMCKALVKHIHALERIAYVLNEMLLESTQAQSFLTLMIILVDPERNRIHFINAGHNPPVLAAPTGEGRLLKQGGGLPMGLFGHARWTREIAQVEPGSTLVIYSDGVSEAERAEDDAFGTERLVATVAAHRGMSARETHDGVREAMRRFVAGNAANDDSTMLVLKF